ncbi:sensor histidine kinase [Bacteroidota bacterium]
MKLTWRKLKLIIIAGTIPPIYFNIQSKVTGVAKYFESNFEFWTWILISISVTVFLALIVFQEINWLEKKLPWKKYAKGRLIVEFFLTTVTVLSTMYIMSFFTYDLHVKWCNVAPAPTFKEHLFEEFTIGMVMLLLILTVTEGAYFFNGWKESLVLSEKLNKEKVESQLEALRNQANPHFLFNSLNVLSSLVHSDADKAEEFIDRFASVYRYVLNIQDKNVVTLKEELDFLNSYLYLQKIRFQDGLEINIDINPECYEHFVLPFSLQFMVENAIKHNIVSKEFPLSINVSIVEDKICIKNNIQRRDSEDESTGMGLKNLQQRYFLLANVMPEYEQKNGEFIVCIPLLKPEKKEEKKKSKIHERCYNRRRKFCSRKIGKATSDTRSED